MSSRWLLVPLFVLLLSSIALSQKHITGFTRESAIGGLPASPVVRSFDINGDSVSEVLLLKAGAFLILDGKSFNTIFQDTAIPGTANLSPADVNQDGYLDLVFTSNGPTVGVWYGPDFSFCRSFPVPGGFGAFLVRNLENGRIEFSFVFQDSYGNGYILRYTDTTFTAHDSTYLPGTPRLMMTSKNEGENEASLFFATYTYYESSFDRFCSYSRDISLRRLYRNNLTGFSIYHESYFGGCFPFCRPSVFIGPSVICNIDDDASPEFIVRWELFGPFCLTPIYTWSFAAYDFLTGTRQWGRSDSSVYKLTSLLTADIDLDGAQELFSYKVQDNIPGLLEFGTSDGATLGFTELPIPSGSFLLGTYGNPPAAKLLMPFADSLIVYRIGCAGNKGDMNADGNVTVFDVTLELNCVFLGDGDCNFCFADVNCDGILSAADVVLELLAVFVQYPFPCS
jgi:hypothetical protein